MKRLKHVKRFGLILLPCLLGAALWTTRGAGDSGHDLFLRNDFTFGRVVYQNFGGYYRGFGFGRWSVDFPSADSNVIRALRATTSLKINEPQAVELTDPGLFDIPFLYILEVGSLQFSPEEVDALREYLLRGGFLMVDDFHGSRQWAVWESQVKRIFPERDIEEIPRDHPILHNYYDFDEYPLVPGTAALRNWNNYERDGALYGHRLRGVADDGGRLMVLMNWNADLGDGWEHAADPYYPREYSVIAYQLAVNYAIYAMTH